MILPKGRCIRSGPQTVKKVEIIAFAAVTGKLVIPSEVEGSSHLWVESTQIVVFAYGFVTA